MSEKWPTTSQLTLAFLKTLRQLGGIARSKDLDEEIIKVLNLSPNLLLLKHSGNRLEIKYRLAWVRTKAKQGGLVTREIDGSWKITDKGSQLFITE